jgi:serine/threonine protein phosphatase 1
MSVNELPSSNRLIAIGDIHGCAKSLEALLKKLSPYMGKDYTFIFIGDYIDRGPDSRGVFDRLIEFEHSEKCFFLRGNHEQMFLNALEGQDRRLWMMNGGIQTISSFGSIDFYEQLPDIYHEFVLRTEIYLDTQDFFFTHGGIHPYYSISEQLKTPGQEAKFLWERNHLNVDIWELEWEKPVVFGHTPVEKVINDAFRLGIDTGCVYSNRKGLGLLTAVVLPERRFVQQEYAEFR